jgi:folate-binding protein YgfZ
MAPALQPAAVPAATADSLAELAALLTGAGVSALDETGWIRVTGSDRVRWLNGMVTNAIQTLAAGEGCYNFVLNAQGRIQGDLTAWMQEESVLLETDRGQMSTLLAHLDHFIIMDDVELADISEPRHGLLVAGPLAASMLGKVDLLADSQTSLCLQARTWHNAVLEVLNTYAPLVPRLELWSDAETIAALRAALIAVGAVSVSPAALEQLRILEGTPRYGVDIRNSATAHDLPQETAQARALHFSKGCYLGQEIVERIRSRGNVHRTFSGFELSGSLPPAGTVLTAEGKPVGELTSVASIQLPSPRAKLCPVQLALGYVRREALDRNLTLEFPGGIATPAALPFAIS